MELNRNDLMVFWLLVGRNSLLFDVCKALDVIKALVCMVLACVALDAIEKVC